MIIILFFSSANSKIIVSNIPSQARYEDLEQFVSQFGTVQNCEKVNSRDGNSQTYQVVYETQDQAQQWVSGLLFWGKIIPRFKCALSVNLFCAFRLFTIVSLSANAFVHCALAENFVNFPILFFFLKGCKSVKWVSVWRLNPEGWIHYGEKARRWQRRHSRRRGLRWPGFIGQANGFPIANLGPEWYGWCYNWPAGIHNQANYTADESQVRSRYCIDRMVNVMVVWR